MSLMVRSRSLPGRGKRRSEKCPDPLWGSPTLLFNVYRNSSQGVGGGGGGGGSGKAVGALTLPHFFFSLDTLNVLSLSRLDVCQCSTLNSGMRTSCKKFFFFKFIFHYYPAIQHHMHGRSHRQHHKTELFSYLDYSLTIYTHEVRSTFPSSWSSPSNSEILLVGFIRSFIWCNLSDCKLSPYLD